MGFRRGGWKSPSVPSGGQLHFPLRAPCPKPKKGPRAHEGRERDRTLLPEPGREGRREARASRTPTHVGTGPPHGPRVQDTAPPPRARAPCARAGGRGRQGRPQLPARARYLRRLPGRQAGPARPRRASRGAGGGRVGRRGWGRGPEGPERRPSPSQSRRGRLRSRRRREKMVALEVGAARAELDSQARHQRCR